MAKKISARRSRPSKPVSKAARPTSRRTSKPAKSPAKNASKSATKSKAKIVAKTAAAAPAPRKGKWVYSFGDGKAEGAAQMKNLLGG